MVFLEKFSVGANVSFWSENGMSSLLWIHCKDFFEILHNERGEEVNENCINGYSEKGIMGKWFILSLKMV